MSTPTRDEIAHLIRFGLECRRTSEEIADDLLDRLRGCMVTDDLRIVRMEHPQNPDWDEGRAAGPMWVGWSVGWAFCEMGRPGDTLGGDDVPLYREVPR